MGMNNKLLRPRQNLHQDAASWAARVAANGGSVGSSLSAVNKFCKDIDAAGLRDRFYRLNLFCGGTSGTAVGLNSALVPLYRGPSLGGTQYGAVIDGNQGPFFSGDYAETGASGGLTSSGTQFLNTGFATNILTAGDRHLAAYEMTRSAATFKYFLGSENLSSTGQQMFVLGYHGNATTRTFGYGAFGASLAGTASTVGGFILGVNSPASTGFLYRNGTQDATNTAAAATPDAANIYVFALNRATAATGGFAGRLGGYSIGLSMTDAQVATYNTIMQAFQTALLRNV